MGAAPGLQVFGRVEIHGASGKVNRSDSPGIALNDGFGTLIVGELQEFGKAGVIKQGGDAEGACVVGGDDGAACLCMLLNESADDGTGDCGLIAGEEDDGADWRECAQAEADGGADAELPVGVVHELWMQGGEGLLNGFAGVAGDDADGIATAFLGGVHGVADEGCAVHFEELLGQAHAGGAAGGEDYAADSMHGTRAGGGTWWMGAAR